MVVGIEVAFARFKAKAFLLVVLPFQTDSVHDGCALVETIEVIVVREHICYVLRIYFSNGRGDEVVPTISAVGGDVFGEDFAHIDLNVVDPPNDL